MILLVFPVVLRKANLEEVAAEANEQRTINWKNDRKLEAHDLAQNKVRKGTRKEDNCAPSLSFLWPLLSGTQLRVLT